MTLLVVESVSKTFVGRRGSAPLHAVRDVSFEVDAGQTLALVGESGAGKSTVGRLVLRLIDLDEGRVLLDGDDLTTLSASGLRRARPKMQMIFQDPHGCLDPRLPIVASVSEPLRLHSNLSKEMRTVRAGELLERVGLKKQFLFRLPHELSGGQLQRIAIARALALEPQLIVCDEPVAALDVSIRAQVLNLLLDLQEELGTSYLFISHDLALVEVFADNIAVMQQGRIVEHGTAGQIFRNPRHEYTRGLLDAIPTLTRKI